MQVSFVPTPKQGWQKLSAGAGANGNRFYDWAVIDLAEPGPGHHQLLIRRNRRTGEFAYYRCHFTRPVPLTTLVRVAGSRWRVDETFQAEKGLTGRDEHQLRRYRNLQLKYQGPVQGHDPLELALCRDHGRATRVPDSPLRVLIAPLLADHRAEPIGDHGR